MAGEHSPEPAGSGKHTWADELRDLMRGIGGAAIIGVPLVYTMEMWQVATTFRNTNILLLLGFGFAACVGYNYFSGFRNNSGLRQALKDALEAVAIGILLSAALLWLLGELHSGIPFHEAASKLAVEAIPLAIGASVANTQFDGGRESSDTSAEPGEREDNDSPRKKTLREIGVTAAGALVFAASIAPTEEVVLIAQNLSSGKLIAVALFSVALSYGMIFVADFTGADARRNTPGLLQSPLGETLLAYAVALAISLTAVRFFHGLNASDSLFSMIALTVTLGLPAAIGGAAGRLLV